MKILPQAMQSPLLFQLGQLVLRIVLRDGNFASKLTLWIFGAGLLKYNIKSLIEQCEDTRPVLGISTLLLAATSGLSYLSLCEIDDLLKPGQSSFQVCPQLDRNSVHGRHERNLINIIEQRRGMI